MYTYLWGFPGSLVIKKPPANAGDPGLISGWGRFPWRRKWQPTPGFVPGESHAQRSLAGYILHGAKKESDTTECVHTGRDSVITGCGSFEQSRYDPLPIPFFFSCESLVSEPVKWLPDQSSDAVFNLGTIDEWEHLVHCGRGGLSSAS